MNKVGLLLINLGTPDQPTKPAVRRYLREFLLDPRVIDIPPLWRWILVNLIILPFRTKKSAAAYQKIWTTEGSPLAFHTAKLATAVQERSGANILVSAAMRYQNPSIAAAIDRFAKANIARLVVLPLFPQYSSAAWGSAVEEVFRCLSKQWNVPSVQVVPPFYDAPEFIDCFVRRLQAELEQGTYDHILFSFHGLPLRHCTKSVPQATEHCVRHPHCCEVLTTQNSYCYRAQCLVTANKISQQLKLKPGIWSVGFQSRLGRTPWVKPYTDEVLDELARQGKRRILLVSPSFVADCLETLEEISIRANEQFTAAGGELVKLVASLNSDSDWADAIVALVNRAHKST